ncbi:MAG: polysaccharide deacetylase family protein [Firmicutes bacterium]|nr:polysaccharide deacetylase family protein [Bacillota bacterium]
MAKGHKVIAILVTIGLGLLIGALPSYTFDHRKNKPTHEQSVDSSMRTASAGPGNLATLAAESKSSHGKYRIKLKSIASSGSKNSSSTSPKGYTKGKTSFPSTVVSSEIEHGPRESKLVALTFNLYERQGQRAGLDKTILRVLIDKKVQATFFMGGRWAESHSQDARSISNNELFEIGNMSYAGKLFTGLTPDQMSFEITKAQESIKFITGVTPVYFRFPFGISNQKALQVADSCGLIPVRWDVHTQDLSLNTSADDILYTVKRGTRGGSIIVMNANGRGWHTAEALPKVIDALRRRGYELVTISELLSYGS